MKTPHLKMPHVKKWNYPALAFAIPVFGMLFIMMVSQYKPFGKYSMLYSDMYHQYYPFFVAFRDALRSGDSLLYNWSVGMGMDYLGLISYYLASPLNLLSVLIPEGWLLGFFSLLMPVKLGLAGLFFALFLKGIFAIFPSLCSEACMPCAPGRWATSGTSCGWIPSPCCRWRRWERCGC